MEDQASTKPTPSTAAFGDSLSRPLALLRTPLYTNAFFLWANTATGAVGGFVFWALVARLYSAEEVGIGSATLSAMALLSTLAHLGLGMGLIRYLPGETGAERRSQLVNFALTAATVGALGASGVFLAGLPLWSPALSYLRQDPLYLLAFLGFTAVSTATTITITTFVALRSTYCVLLTGMLIQILRLALPAAFVGLGAFGVVTAGGLAGLLGLVAALLLLRVTQRSYQPRPFLDLSAARLLVPFGLGNQASDLALAAPTLVLPLIVVNRLGAESGAHFYIGFFLGALLLLGSQGLAMSLFAEGSHNETELGRRAWHAFLGAFLISAAGALLMLAAGDRLLLLFGRPYANEATGLLRLVALAALPASITYTCLAVLRVRRQIKALLVVTWSVCLLSLGLSYVLLPRMGIIGPGIGLLAGQGLGGFLGLVYLAKQRTQSTGKTLEAWSLQAQAQTDEGI